MKFLWCFANVINKCIDFHLCSVSFFSTLSFGVYETNMVGITSVSNDVFRFFEDAVSPKNNGRKFDSLTLSSSKHATQSM